MPTNCLTSTKKSSWTKSPEPEHGGSQSGGKTSSLKPHPTFSPADCLIVEDTKNDTIASSTLYLTQEWQTDSASFNVGRPEIVGTRKPYRNQGLIRKQFNLMHQWAEQRGHDITVVNGIPHYYRQFGYDMAINDLADRQNRLEAFPRWKPDEQRPYVLRDPTLDDIPFITQLLNQSADRSLYNPVFKHDEVSYIVFDRSPEIRSKMDHRHSVPKLRRPTSRTHRHDRIRARHRH